MSPYDHYKPGPATGAHIDKNGEEWTLVLVRELRHSPDKVWLALTDPAQLAEWAPFNASRSMASVGTVSLTTVNAPVEQVSQTEITRAVEPKLLEYKWGDGQMRWELEAKGQGTRLTLWHGIARPYIAMGAAGWHICLDVLDRHIAGQPLGRIVGMGVMQFEGWQRLKAEYEQQFGVKTPDWSNAKPE
jgi:uncharacterized protein YndB with AHSA1/START domain